MKQPDAFERKAMELRLDYQASPWIDESNKWIALEQYVSRLLRRHHAKIERTVRKLRDEAVVSQFITSLHCSSYRQACDEILKELKAMQRGK